jgi:hypothetical protein
MAEAQRMGDLDTEHRLLCLVARKARDGTGTHMTQLPSLGDVQDR